MFSNNVYNIRTGENDTLEFKVDGGPVVQAILGPGYYNIVQAATAIETVVQAQLDALYPGHTIQVTYNPITQKLESTVVGGTFSWEVGTANAYVGLLTDAPSPTLPDGTMYPFPNFANLYGLESVTISVRSQDQKTILNSSPNTFLTTNSVGVVPVNVPFGGLVEYNQFSLEDSMVDFLAFQNLNSMQIAIRDPTGAGVPNQKPHFLVELMVYFPDGLNA